MLQQQIKAELPAAMKAKDAVRVSVIRGMITAFTNELVAKGIPPQEPLDDEGVLTVIRRLSKQRKDSIEQFTKGGRPELAEKEQAELTILESYLPQMMPLDEIKVIAAKKKEEMGVTDKSKMGMLMGAIMKDLKGKADGADVKTAVEGLFT
jgi:uncharacterized protein YqeY